MSELLLGLGLSHHVATFEEEEMDLDVVRDVMRRQGRRALDDVFKELGVHSMGERTRIANALL